MTIETFHENQLQRHDALILVDIQNDFLPGGALGVAGGDRIVPVINRYIESFRTRGLPVFATRDWHPPNHCSFRTQGGPWPPHCIADSPGSRFAAGLHLPENAIIISKATQPDQDAYSGFEHTTLHQQLLKLDIKRLFVGGLATDYCVLNTVKDALELGYRVHLLTDAVRAVNVKPDDGRLAIENMLKKGAIPTKLA
jgi:nicotinamidase/pyrazinamidase